MTTNKETIKRWIDRSPPEGHNSRWSIWYEWATIYSYGRHFPLAVLTGERTAAVNTDKYSATTTRHRSLVATALRQAGYTIEYENLAAIQAKVARTARDD